MSAAGYLINAGCFMRLLLCLTVTLAVSVVSFPVLLDRDAGALAAVATSIKTVLKNLGSDGALGPHCGGGAG